MKRLAVVCFLAFLFWGIVPAGANTVAPISISCDAVSFSWGAFPARDVILHVSVEEGDGVTVASFNTKGAMSGDGSVPVTLHSGSASAVLSWTLRAEHHAGPVTEDLDCTTTTSTTEPSTTTSTVPEITTTPNTVPVTSAPPECGPATLPCTGGGAANVGLVVFGGALLGMGALLIALARSRRASR